MAPTLQNSRLYILNRFIYLIHPPQPADIVVLRDPKDKGWCVKRVIAKAGDTVFIQQGQVFVNHTPLREPYLPQGTRTYANGNVREQTFQLGEKEFFVLGDNRMNSADSRTYGPISQDQILGRVNP